MHTPSHERRNCAPKKLISIKISHRLLWRRAKRAGVSDLAPGIIPSQSLYFSGTNISRVEWNFNCPPLGAHPAARATERKARARVISAQYEILIMGKHLSRQPRLLSIFIRYSRSATCIRESPARSPGFLHNRVKTPRRRSVFPSAAGASK